MERRRAGPWAGRRPRSRRRGRTPRRRRRRRRRCRRRPRGRLAARCCDHQESPSAPGTRARSSASPASCTFSSSTWALRHGRLRAELGGELVIDLAVEHVSVALLQRREVGLQLVEARVDAGEQLGVGLLERRREGLDHELGALDVRHEVPQVGLGVAVLLAGDLALGDLLDELGGAERHGGRRDLEGRPRPTRASARSASSWSANFLPPAVVFFTQSRCSRRCHPVNVGSFGAGEVVDARVDRAVDVRDEARDRLDPLPRLTARREGGLGGGQVAGADGVGEDLGAPDDQVGLRVDVVRVVGDRGLHERIVGGDRRELRAGEAGARCRAGARA